MSEAKDDAASHGEQLARSLDALLDRVTIGEPMHSGAITLFPLSGSNGRPSRYILLDNALERDLAFITEVSEGGSVPELSIENRSDRPVLILEGDVLIGAKQNRVVNLTVLVPPKSRLQLPVSCVERGRWNWKRRDFAVSRSAPLDLRRNKTAAMIEEKKRSGRRTSNQMRVWQDVSTVLSCVNAHSETDSLEDAYVSSRSKLRRTLDTLKLPAGATGFIVALNGRVVGLDLFDSVKTAERCWTRLSESYALSALHLPPAEKPATLDMAGRFLCQTRKSLRGSATTLGLGAELEIDSAWLTGTGLWYDDRIVHLAAFTRE